MNYCSDYYQLVRITSAKVLFCLAEWYVTCNIIEQAMIGNALSGNKNFYLPLPEISVPLLVI
jgi:hypothetical protein